MRAPQQDPFAHGSGRLALLLRSERGTRLIALGDRLVTLIVIIASVLLAWFLFASLYLVMRDDYVLTSLMSERRSAYLHEDRVVELRQRLDRISAKQLLTQDSVEGRVAQLIARQAELEARHMAVNDLSTRAERAGLPLPAAITGASPPSSASAFAPAAQGPRKPQPLPPTPGASGVFAPLSPRASVDTLVEAIEQRAGVVEREQSERLRAIHEAAEGELARSRRMVAALGLDPSRFGKAAFTLPAIRKLTPLDTFMLRDVGSGEDSAMGGPLLPPVAGPGAAERFEQDTQRAEKALEGARGARAILDRLPVGRPMPERFEQTSSYGTRVDPFLGSLAQHSGIDFRAPTGTPVAAIAAGRIVQAGSAGGYGRMVEIDHGHGLTTRYAHLSAIEVSEGDEVRKGEIIGAVGSTGRSTGPHLHYEVRIDEDAADPARFIRASRLAGM